MLLSVKLCKSLIGSGLSDPLRPIGADVENIILCYLNCNFLICVIYLTGGDKICEICDICVTFC